MAPQINPHVGSNLLAIYMNNGLLVYNSLQPVSYFEHMSRAAACREYSAQPFNTTLYSIGSQAVLDQYGTCNSDSR